MFLYSFVLGQFDQLDQKDLSKNANFKHLTVKLKSFLNYFILFTNQTIYEQDEKYVYYYFLSQLHQKNKKLKKMMNV